MRLRLATAATTLVLLLAAALRAEPVAAHGLRSSSFSSSSAPQAALHEARAQQEQATEVDVAALPEGMVLGLMEADKRQESAMAMLHDALVAGLQGEGGRKLFPSTSNQDVDEIIRCFITPGDGWSESGAPGHHGCKLGVAFFSLIGTALLLSPVLLPIYYGMEAVHGLSGRIDGTKQSPPEYIGVEGVNPERPPVEGAYRTKDSDLFQGKEALSSTTSDDEREEEYQRLVEEAQQALEKAISAFQKLAAARRL